MAKDETTPGLLSKMVKFVRNPATSWSELDTRETDRDEAISKLHLKEMIERKRRNDFVRKREFDMLRKMRKRESIVGQDAAGRPSFFQSSLPSKPDDRAKTLKKIDEIEAQMSMQWWKTKQGNSSSLQSGDSSMNFPSVPSVPIPARKPTPHLLDEALPTTPAGYGITEPIGLQVAQGRSASLSVSALPGSTALRPASSRSSPPPPPPEQAMFALDPDTPVNRSGRPVVMNGLASSSYEAGASGFTPTNMMALEVLEVAHDADLEEASIRFANGDDAGAEAGLLEILAAGSIRAGQSDTWMVLFDLYRATDQQDKFETAAINFVQRFDRSAPQWFSLPEAVKKLVVPVATTAGNGPNVDWICPSTVGIQTVAALKVALAKAPMPWRLDWSNLKAIEPMALEAVCSVFTGWSAQPVQLRFIGENQLRQLLQKNTPSGDRDTLQEWWHLRMEALRVTHRPDEFELAALDFCVTYEVSPPAWGAARCDYKAIDAQGSALATHTIIGDVFRDSLPSGLTLLDGDSQMSSISSQMGSLMSVELSGQIEGDVAAMLDVLQAKLLGADSMVISCAKLIRVDFSAAGTLLNWVSARQDEGRSVHFYDVNRLVAAFFNVIGITEHAKVTTRRD
jgi:ABC-type transporter Mla MlaB component